MKSTEYTNRYEDPAGDNMLSNMVNTAPVGQQCLMGIYLQLKRNLPCEQDLFKHGRMRLLPALSKEWGLDFKLHAPHNTTVEGRVRNGKLQDLDVTPRLRIKTIIAMEVK